MSPSPIKIREGRDTFVKRVLIDSRKKRISIYSKIKRVLIKEKIMKIRPHRIL